MTTIGMAVRTRPVRRLPVAGAGILILFFLTAVLAPRLAPHDPIRQDLANTLMPPAWQTGGHADHLLGTDSLGRDVLSRLIFGSRISLFVGLLSVLLALTVGTWAGVLAGFVGGWVETMVMRLADMQLAMPFMLMTIAIIGALGPSTTNVTIVLAIGLWPSYARMVRGEVLSIKQNQFIDAAIVAGCSTPRLVVSHILPNIVNTMIVMASLNFGAMIVFEGSLSFLGVGVQPPTPSWGGMLADGRAYLTVAWHLATFPGLAIMLVVLATNSFGDWLRDALDPRRKTPRVRG